MILKRDWKKIVTEHYDVFDPYTRRRLLSLEESEKDQALASLSAKLYSIIVDKTTEIDYGDIPRSKGDITKIPNFVSITECLDTIRGILIEFKEDTEPVDEILKAIDNLRESRDIWEKAYTFGSSLPITFYETMALAIVSSTSLLISTSIDYIKEPSENSYTISLDKVSYHKNKDALLFRNLRKFNKAYKNGEVRKVMETTLKVREEVKEAVDIVNEFSASAVIAAVVTAGVVVSMISLIVPILHELTAFFFCSKQHVSDFFAIQADLLALNAESVKLDYTKTEKERDKIYNKQMKLVTRFKKIANALAVKLKSAEKRGENMYKKESSAKFTIDRDTDTLKTTSSSSMF